MSKKIVMLAGEGDSTRFLYNSLQGEMSPLKVIIENKPDRATLLKRRAAKLGWFSVIGQILFMAGVVPFINRSSRSRQEEIKNQFQLDDSPINEQKVVRVDSVNDQACIDILEEIQPDLVIVNGTRIVSKKVLNSTSATFFNTHTGITPEYRGVHGGYWAMANGDRENCGVTVHLVDPGIDTGGILFQDIIQPGDQDNYCSYPLLQFAKGIDLIKKAITQFQAGELEPYQKKKSESALFFHPTAWFYLWTRLTKGIG